MFTGSVLLVGCPFPVAAVASTFVRLDDDASAGADSASDETFRFGGMMAAKVRTLYERCATLVLALDGFLTAADIKLRVKPGWRQTSGRGGGRRTGRIRRWRHSHNRDHMGAKLRRRLLSRRTSLSQTPRRRPCAHLLCTLTALLSACRQRSSGCLLRPDAISHSPFASRRSLDRQARPGWSCASTSSKRGSESPRWTFNRSRST
jgi:hypothetical protein